MKPPLISWPGLPVVYRFRLLCSHCRHSTVNSASITIYTWLFEDGRPNMMNKKKNKMSGDMKLTVKGLNIYTYTVTLMNVTSSGLEFEVAYTDWQ